MRKLLGLLSSALAFACLAMSPAVPAYEVPPQAVTVTFARGYEVPFKRAYGAREVLALHSQIVDSVSQSLKSAGGRCSLPLDLTLERAAPTHPTMEQQLDNPSLDPVRTVFRNGGAALTGHVLDSGGHVLATVKYDYFSDYFPPVSRATDPWSEARVAIDAFSGRLVAACIKQSALPAAEAPAKPGG